MNQKNYYITTTLPYINAKPHLGFSREIVQADVWARLHQIGDSNVVFNTGTDEHGQKIHEKALEQGKELQAYCDEYSLYFSELKEILNLNYSHFIRTTDEHHIKAAQEFWKICDKNGDIYKKKYETKYCVGCELEKTDSELLDGFCPDHPGRVLEIRSEENYFFKFSNYKDKLLDLYKNNTEFVRPQKRFNEIIAFIERGPQDFSISRLKAKMPWGITVPGDDKHVMYVWFDALVNYVSTLGWPENKENFERFWPGVQIAGKDNLRQQSAMWQAMLMSAHLPNSKSIFINGFISVDNQKMSKSLGNIIHPQELVEKFNRDGARYLLLSLGNFGEDTNITWNFLVEKYNADLANGLGNLVARVIKLSENMVWSVGEEKEDEGGKVFSQNEKTEMIKKYIEQMEHKLALEEIWKYISSANKYIEDTKPWELKKTDLGEFKKIMQKLLYDLSYIAYLLQPFMPETATKIKKALVDKHCSTVLFQKIK